MVTDPDPDALASPADLDDELRTEEETNWMTKLALKLLKENGGYTQAAKVYLDLQPLYYDDNQIWWRWNEKEYRWEITNETWVIVQAKLLMRKILIGDTSVKRRVFLVEAFRQEATLRRPGDWRPEWVQFQRDIYNVRTGKFTQATHEHFCANPIPWRVGDKSDTPTMDQLFSQWVGQEHVQTLYEIIAYCTYQDYPIHRIFCFHGGGSNGKSKFLQLLTRFLGEDNVVSSDLQMLADNRFESSKLYKKLACQMGETDYAALQHTNRLKRLSGQDPIDFEFKNKNPFTGKNYAKIIVATNSLPPSGDTSDGFYRRWLIIDFPNHFQEGPDPVVSIPDSEFESLARKVTQILPNLLHECSFHGEGDIEQRKKAYVSLSNPLGEFLSERYVRDIDGRVKYSEMWAEYRRWLGAKKRRIVRRNEFKEALVQEGFDVDKQRLEGSDMTFCVVGLRERPVVISDGRNLSIQAATELALRIASLPELREFFGARRAPVKYEDLLEKVSPSVQDAQKWLDSALQMLTRTGDVYEVKPGVYGGLR